MLEAPSNIIADICATATNLKRVTLRFHASQTAQAAIECIKLTISQCPLLSTCYFCLGREGDIPVSCALRGLRYALCSDGWQERNDLILCLGVSTLEGDLLSEIRQTAGALKSSGIGELQTQENIIFLLSHDPDIGCGAS